MNEPQVERPLFQRVLLGGDYNPEQWPDRAIWQADMRLMQLAGINTVTLGVFSWGSIQLTEDRYDFGWLDESIALLTAHGISICLGTGTAAPPPWLAARYPEILPVDDDGVRRDHGGRMQFCPTSPTFRRYALAYTRQIAERYGHHPNLILWHVSNEYGPYCYCDGCAVRFRQWLRGRYASLDDLNDRWVMRFWGQAYSDWEEIQPPRMRGERSHQALMLNYQRFMSAMNLECYRAEADLLRTISPTIPVMTNFHGPRQHLDYHAWAAEQDIIAWDAYPQPTDHPSAIAFQYDLMRGLKSGEPWLLFEQTPSQTQWRPYNPLLRPGEMRLRSYQAIAHGADGVMFFQWRKSPGGEEQQHGAIVSHAGHEHTRTFQEVAAMYQELQKIDAMIRGSRVQARVALLFSWENWWALRYRPALSADLDYLDEVHRYHRAFRELGLAVDVLPPGGDLSGYAVVIAPLWHLFAQADADAVATFVANGGTFLASYGSGAVDPDQRIWVGGAPGPLRDLLGIWVEESDVLMPDQQNRVIWAPTQAAEGSAPSPTAGYTCDRWCDLVQLNGAKALASYGEDFYAGRPAITRHQVGRGQSYYVATRPTVDLLIEIARRIADEQQLAAPFPVPADVTIMQRSGAAGSITFLLNHAPTPSHVDLPAPLRDLLTGEMHTRELTLPRYGVVVLQAISSAQ